MPSGIVKLNKGNIMRYFVIKKYAYRTQPDTHYIDHNAGFDNQDTAQRYADVKQEMETDRDVTYTVIAFSGNGII